MEGSIGKHGKMFDAPIDANQGTGWMSRLCNNHLGLDRHKPVAAFPGDCHILRDSDYVPTLPKVELTQLGQENTFAFDLEALWIPERIRGNEFLLKGWKTLLRLLFIESVLDGPVQVHQDLLKRL